MRVTGPFHGEAMRPELAGQGLTVLPLPAGRTTSETDCYVQTQRVHVERGVRGHLMGERLDDVDYLAGLYAFQVNTLLQGQDLAA